MNPNQKARMDRADERRFLRLEQSSRPHALKANEQTTHLAFRVPPSRISGVEFWAEVLDVSEQRLYAEHGRRVVTAVIRKAIADKLREWRVRVKEREKKKTITWDMVAEAIGRGARK